MTEQSANNETLFEQYESLRALGSGALEAGKLEEALGHFRCAHELAQALESTELADLAYCNCVAVEIRLGGADRLHSPLQRILLRTNDTRVALFSAYNLALLYDQLDNYKKALFYARIAERYASELGDVRLQGWTRNQIGNVLAALNRFDDALDSFEAAHTKLAGDDSTDLALVLDNLGYCHVVLGEHAQGFGELFRSLRMLRRCGAHLYEAEPRLALAFAYLDIGRPGRAAHHADRALEIAERSGDQRSTKYALLLLGEAYKLAGRVDAAGDCFRILQEGYFPEMPEVPGMLLDLDICRVINLRA